VEDGVGHVARADGEDGGIEGCHAPLYPFRGGDGTIRGH
jgi:hypothetical protein